MGHFFVPRLQWPYATSPDVTPETNLGFLATPTLCPFSKDKLDPTTYEIAFFSHIFIYRPTSSKEVLFRNSFLDVQVVSLSYSWQMFELCIASSCHGATGVQRGGESHQRSGELWGRETTISCLGVGSMGLYLFGKYITSIHSELDGLYVKKTSYTMLYHY